MKTTTKEVTTKLREHILDYYEEHGLDGLRDNVNALKFGGRSDYQAASELVMGGDFLIYHFDVNNFMNDLNINDKQKDYTDDQTWDLYVHLLAREICKLIKETK